MPCCRRQALGALILLALAGPAHAVDPRETVDWLTRRAVRDLQADDMARRRPEQPRASPYFGQRDPVVRSPQAPTVCNTVRIDRDLSTTICD